MAQFEIYALQGRHHSLTSLLPQIYADAATQKQILHFADHLASDGVIACDLAGQPIGFLLVQIADRTADIIDIGTIASWRRLGVGSAMLRHMCTDMQEASLDTLFLDAAIDNIPAIGLYQKAGFVEIGRRTGYYRRGSHRIDAIQMAYSQKASQ